MEGEQAFQAVEDDLPLRVRNDGFLANTGPQDADGGTRRRDIDIHELLQAFDVCAFGPNENS